MGEVNGAEYHHGTGKQTGSKKMEAQGELNIDENKD